MALVTFLTTPYIKLEIDEQYYVAPAKITYSEYGAPVTAEIFLTNLSAGPIGVSMLQGNSVRFANNYAAGSTFGTTYIQADTSLGLWTARVEDGAVSSGVILEEPTFEVVPTGTLEDVAAALGVSLDAAILDGAITAKEQKLLARVRQIERNVLKGKLDLVVAEALSFIDDVNKLLAGGDITPDAADALIALANAIIALTTP